jgi:hypothetical protein
VSESGVDTKKFSAQSSMKEIALDQYID